MVSRGFHGIQNRGRVNLQHQEKAGMLWIGISRAFTSSLHHFPQPITARISAWEVSWVEWKERKGVKKASPYLYSVALMILLFCFLLRLTSLLCFPSTLFIWKSNKLNMVMHITYRYLSERVREHRMTNTESEYKAS